MVEIAKACHEGDRVTLHGMSMVLRSGSQAHQNTAQQISQNSHLVGPPCIYFEIRAPTNENGRGNSAIASAASLCQIEALAKSPLSEQRLDTKCHKRTAQRAR